MSGIALYNTLRKIPEVSEAEAKEAVVDITSSKEVATKADIAELKAETKADIAGLEIKLTKQMYAVAGIIIAAVGLMIKFLCWRDPIKGLSTVL